MSTMIGVTVKLRKNTESNGDVAPQQDGTERGCRRLGGLRLTPRGDAERKADFPGGRSNSSGYGHFKFPHLTTVG
jgi:hypothetical protein